MRNKKRSQSIPRNLQPENDETYPRRNLHPPTISTTNYQEEQEENSNMYSDFQEIRKNWLARKNENQYSDLFTRSTSRRSNPKNNLRSQRESQSNTETQKNNSYRVINHSKNNESYTEKNDNSESQWKPKQRSSLRTKKSSKNDAKNLQNNKEYTELTTKRSSVIQTVTYEKNTGNQRQPKNNSLNELKSNSTNNTKRTPINLPLIGPRGAPDRQTVSLSSGNSYFQKDIIDIKPSKDFTEINKPEKKEDKSEEFEFMVPSAKRPKRKLSPRPIKFMENQNMLDNKTDIEKKKKNLKQNGHMNDTIIMSNTNQRNLEPENCPTPRRHSPRPLKIDKNTNELEASLHVKFDLSNCKQPQARRSSNTSSSSIEPVDFHEPTDFSKVMRFPKSYLANISESITITPISSIEMIPIDEFLEVEKRFELEETEAEEEEELNETVLNFQKMIGILKSQFSGKTLRDIYNSMRDNSRMHFVLLLSHPLKQIDSVYLLRNNMKSLNIIWGNGPKNIKQEQVFVFWEYNPLTRQFNKSRKNFFHPNLDAVSLI
ncbi:hypothetical protein GPJ56_001046 [Histomonas meleagridis]|uniref:uncharacterized protein n=1 Tax=Histomonas meleagridis TaxID=135588 RepID=UPI003559E431|nr:hypothetical protein GPJ56_001046 [Histomonas meleagridis]KAH0804835.1 hypothetical protein GO595_002349 [Histomonas meleagridis]